MARETATQKAAAIATTMDATRDKTEAVQIAAVKAVGAPGRGATDFIWIVVVLGLVGVLFYALWGITDLLTNDQTTKSPDKLITIFTTALAALIGLFAPSPLQNRGGSGA
jgi:hypothetical protein